MSRRQWRIAAVIAAAALFLWSSGWTDWASLAGIQQRYATILGYVAAHHLLAASGFFMIYVLATALSFPGAAVLTLAGGAFFGFVEGTLLAALASGIGSVLAFWSARYLLRGWVERRFPHHLRGIDAGIAREGAFYLLSLRLIPLFPFVVVNLAMGLTRMPVWTYYWVSQLGMLPGTAIYVNAGTQLSHLSSLRDVMSPGLLMSLCVIGVFPLLVSAVLERLRDRRILARFEKPRQFDFNLIVVGGGAAGLVSAQIAAALGAKVALVERGHMGGDCLNTGCVPSKALLRAAKAASDVRTAERFGVVNATGSVDFAAVMQRVREVISTIAPHDSPERYASLGVDCRLGDARIESPWRVAVDGVELTTRAIIVASGGRPFVPRLPGLESIPFSTTESVWHLPELPRRLLILGGGPVGCELAQAFARLGSAVTLVEVQDRLLPREEAEASTVLQAALEREGVAVVTGFSARLASPVEDGFVLTGVKGDAQTVLAFDHLLLAVGRQPNTEGLGLERLGVVLGEDGRVIVDRRLRSSVPTLFACGDVIGPPMFTHVAAHEAFYAVSNALFGNWKSLPVDYSVMPTVVFTDPQVARVGVSEAEACAQNIAFEKTSFQLAELDRAITDGCREGFISVLTVPRSDRILGVTWVGEAAGEAISEFALAMRHGLGLGKILNTVHAYPSLSEANRFVAGHWRKAHVPQRIREWAARFFRWHRG